MNAKSPQHFRWKNIAADGHWRLESPRGKRVAEVAVQPTRWIWKCDLPPEWMGEKPAGGLAVSLEAAKAICEAIVAGIPVLGTKPATTSSGKQATSKKKIAPKKRGSDTSALYSQMLTDFSENWAFSVFFGRNRLPGDAPPVTRSLASLDGRWECLRPNFYYMLNSSRNGRMAGIFLSDPAADGTPRWYWGVGLPMKWSMQDAGVEPHGHATTLEAARRICETIIAATVECDTAPPVGPSEEVLSRGYQWKTIANDAAYRLSATPGGDVAEVTAVPRRWVWKYFYSPEWSQGNPPTGLTDSPEAGKAICDAIAAGTAKPRLAILKTQADLKFNGGSQKPNKPFPPSPFSRYIEAMAKAGIPPEPEYEQPDPAHTRAVMKTTSLRNYRWKRSGGGEYHLRPQAGSVIGENGYRDSRIATIGYPNPDSDKGKMLWYWNFSLPSEWSAPYSAQYGLAHSIESAKTICETIAAATVESSAPAEGKPVSAVPTTLPFKHGCSYNAAARKAVERRLNFRFPADFLAAYGDWNGGSLDGFIVFSTTVCTGFYVHKFLAFLGIDAEDEYQDSILTHARNNLQLKDFAPNKLPYIPFAIVDGVEDDDEASPYNVPSLLVFGRRSKDICVLSGYEGRKVWVSRTWTKFAKAAEYRFEG